MSLDHFHYGSGRYPTSDEGLAALVERPAQMPADQWLGPFTNRSSKTDPWGHAYVYRCPGVHNPDSYDLYSLGRDGISLSEGADPDDCNTWDDSWRTAWDWDQLPRRWPLRVALAVANQICLAVVTWRHWPGRRARGDWHGVLALLWLSLSIPAVLLLLPSSGGSWAGWLVHVFALVASWPPALVLALSGPRRASRTGWACEVFAILLLLGLLVWSLAGSGKMA